MVRKGSINSSSEQHLRPEATGKVCKIVLEKLNIPLDSAVLVKGDSIIYPSDSSAGKELGVNNVIDITVSDSEEEVLQETMVKNCQSTETNVCNKSDSLDTCRNLVNVSDVKSSQQRTSYKLYPHSGKASRTIKPSLKNQEKFAQSKVVKKNVKKMSRNPRSIRNREDYQNQVLIRKAAKRLLESESAEKVIKKDRLSTSDEQNIVVVEQTSLKNSSEKTIIKNSLINNSVSTNNSKIRPHTKKIQENIGQSPSNSQEIDNPLEMEEGMDKSFIHETLDENESKIDFTPSRISQRIKNKKVKFSARQLLAGGDLYALRRELKEAKENKIKPKQYVSKSKVINTADINANNSSLLLNKSEGTPVSNSPNKFRANSLNASPSERLNISESRGDIEATQTRSNNTVEARSTSSVKDKQYSNLTEGNEFENNLIECTTEYTKFNKRNMTNISLENQYNSDISTDQFNIVDATGNKGKTIQKPGQMTSVLGAEKSGNVKKVSDKITLKLQGTPQRKVVNISISPLKESMQKQFIRRDNIKEKLNVGLGPDIIIRRVKSGKVQMNDKSEENSASSEHTNVINDDLVVKNIIYPEKAAMRTGTLPIKDIEVPPQIQKLFEATKQRTISSESIKSRNATVIRKNTAVHGNKKKKRFAELNKRHAAKNAEGKQKLLGSKGKTETKNKLPNRSIISEGAGTSDKELDQDEGNNESELILSSTCEEESSFISPDKNSRKSQDTESVSLHVEKVGGKKTAKVTPLRQVNKIQPRSEILKKSTNEKERTPIEKDNSKFYRSKAVPKLNSPSELCILGGKRNYKNAFEKYFICIEKECENKDGVDSESGGEETNLLSHFIDFKKRPGENKELERVENEDGLQADDPRTTENSNGVVNINNSPEVNLANEPVEDHFSSSFNELIKGITVDLPKWNCQVLPESSLICMFLLERDASGTLDVKKCIEIDSSFKATVYVNKMLVHEYCGLYDNFDAIKNLIYQVDLL